MKSDSPMNNKTLTSQRGGTFLGFVFGLIVGLFVSLALAVYVTKVPIPFLNKGLIHSADESASEDKKNKDWDPNAPLYNKGGAKDASKEDASSKPAEKSTGGFSNPLSGLMGGAAAPQAASNATSNPSSTSKDADKAEAGTEVVMPKPQSGEPFEYYVQAGAFRTHDEADTQKAKLALGGFDAQVSEREQSGKSVFRVRLGPLVSKDDAEKLQQKLVSQKVESVIIRVQK
jgi:cell division protein FtsN